MGNFARKIIDAVQNTLLDHLLMQLFSLWWFAWAWAQMDENVGFDVIGTIVAAWALIFFFAWLIGVIANRRPRPTTRTAYDQLHETPPNGFAAWQEEPEGGLRPYRPMRAVVLTLGYGSGIFIDLLQMVFGLSGIAAAAVIALASPDFLSGLHPALGSFEVRQQIFIGSLLLTLATTVRAWARGQRDRLLPAENERPRSRVLGGVFTFTLATGLLAYTAFLFNAPAWWGAVIAAGLFTIGLASPWRDNVAAFLFGKPERSTR